MVSLPLIARELRVQSRRRFTYDARLGWGLVAAAALGFFVWNFPRESASGRNVFALMHGCLAVMLFLAAPIGAADTISREKREGTLGLLMVTQLTPTQVVLGKFAAHFVRLFYFGLTMLPFLLIPALLGGVELRDFVFSTIVLASIAAAGLSGGMIASALYSSFGAALAWAMIFGSIFTVAMGALPLNGMIAVFPHRNLGDIPWGFRIFGLGPLTQMFPMQAREVVGMLFPSRSTFTFLECGLGLLSFVFLRVAMIFCARKMALHTQFAGETKRQEAFRRRFLTPMFWKSAFRRTMGRRLDRNPLNWLEYRTAWTRAARSALLLGVAAIEATLFVHPPNREEFIGIHFYLLIALVAFVTFKSSSSFQQEKESGAFELLLVTPLTERKLFSARLRAVANYYALTVMTLASLGLLGFNWTQPSPYYQEQNRLSAAVNFASMGASLISAPVVGLYFALRCRTFLTALMSTAGLVVAGPLCGWFAFNGMLWMAASRGSPRFAVLAQEWLQNHWWPAIFGMLLYHALVAALCGRAAIELLRRREFCGNRR